MQYLSFSTLVVPLISILLDILFYFILLKKTKQKNIFKRYVCTILLFAFLFNVGWEILQVPLYDGGMYSWGHILFCTLASVVDALMVLLIFFGFAIIYKNALWIQNLNLGRIILLISTGAIGAVLAEFRYLSIGIWNYADTMPVIPILNAGLAPVLQFMILPLLIYLLCFKLLMGYLKNDRKRIYKK